MIYSASQISALMSNGKINIFPFELDCLKKGSYSFRLDPEVMRIKEDIHEIELGFDDKNYVKEYIDPIAGALILPGEFILCKTLERLKLSLDISCILSARGSCAQIGLNVLQSSQYAEPGTDQKLLLEISNNGPAPVRLRSGAPIVKGIFLSVGANNLLTMQTAAA